jgi:hypothetical protein
MVCIRCSLVWVILYSLEWMKCNLQCMRCAYSLLKWFADCHCKNTATVLDQIPASPDTVKSRATDEESFEKVHKNCLIVLK